MYELAATPCLAVVATGVALTPVMPRVAVVVVASAPVLVAGAILAAKHAPAPAVRR